MHSMTQLHILTLQLTQWTGKAVKPLRVHSVYPESMTHPMSQLIKTLQRPASRHDTPFQRDGPASLVDRVGNARHIGKGMCYRDGYCSDPQQPRTGRGMRHRQYRFGWLGRMMNSWEHRAVLITGVPDCGGIRSKRGYNDV
ncbi:hypothetical protein PI125_g14660 [Phytophthora idaei]|nr:hypothetical protein PI125_g14660 [Phytophthora idaei]